MRRILVVGGLLLVLTVAAGAAAYAGKLPFLNLGSAPDPVTLIPNEAELMFGMSAPAVLKSEFFANGLAEAEEELRETPRYEEFQEALAKSKSCGYALENLDRVTGGVSRDEKLVIVLTGSGIGSKEKLSCLSENEPSAKPVERHGREAWVMESTDGKPDLIVYFASEDMVIAVHPDWESLVLGLLDGKGLAAKDGNLSRAYADANPAGDIWLAGTVSDELSGRMGAPGVVSDFVAGMRIHDGFAADLAMTVTDEAKVKELLEQAKPYFNMAKVTASTVGVPASVIERGKLEVSQGKLRASIDANEEEMQALGQVMENLGQMAEASAALGAVDGDPDAPPDGKPIPAFRPSPDGVCDASYRLVDDVCVHLEYRPGEDIGEELESYMRGGVPPIVSGSPALHDADQPLETEDPDTADPAPAVPTEEPSDPSDTAEAAPSDAPDDFASSEHEDCEKAKTTLARFQQDIANGINPRTGEKEQLPPAESTLLIEKRKEVVDIFCSDLD